MELNTEQYQQLIGFWVYKENKIYLSAEDIYDLASFLAEKTKRPAQQGGEDAY